MKKQFGTSFDVIKSLLSSLTEKEKKELSDSLGVGPSPCQKQGHKFRILDKKSAWFVFPGYTRVYCERCGKVQKNYT